MIIRTVLGSEIRTVELFPLADSHVYLGSPYSNYGKELYLNTEYEDQKIVVNGSTFEVPPGSRWILISLPKNGRITGSFWITQGGNRDIDFWIKNADLTITYVHESRVTNLEFSFVAPCTGDFFLQFDNSFSWFTTKTVSLSDVILTMEPFDAICSPIFLLFDLASIPPEATINSAILSMAFSSSGNAYSIVKAFHCLENDWDEQTIAYENAPLSETYLISSSTLNVSDVPVGDYCEWDVKSDVVRSLLTGKLTEVIAIVSSEDSSGMIQFLSRESEIKPKLEISYTYVSVNLSASPNIVREGDNVAINVSTDPLQTEGVITIQYSTDQILWHDIDTFSVGFKEYAWTPAITGLIYVRALWSTSWTGGSYTSSKIVSFNVDATPPSVSISLPSTGAVMKSSSIEVAWNGSDEVSGIDHYEIKIDGESWVNVGLDTAYTFTELADGSHIVVVKAVDKVLLSNEESMNFIVNTSLIMHPGWVDDIAVFGVIIAAIMLSSIYYWRKRKMHTKKSSKNHE